MIRRRSARGPSVAAWGPSGPYRPARRPKQRHACSSHRTSIFQTFVALLLERTPESFWFDLRHRTMSICVAHLPERMPPRCPAALIGKPHRVASLRGMRLKQPSCGILNHPWREWPKFSPVLRKLTSLTRNITPRWLPPSESISFSLSLNAIGAPLAKLQNDLSEFVELLNSSGVEYLVVGGHAVAFHGHPRLTGDIDFFVRPTQENGKQTMCGRHWHTRHGELRRRNCRCRELPLGESNDAPDEPG